MYPHKAEKIDLNAEYPCVCSRRGCLKPIALTDALGCDRCQQIFVVDHSGCILEELSTHPPYKKTWHWTGRQWHRTDTTLRETFLPLSMLIVVIPLVLLFFVRHFPAILWIVLVFAIVPIPALLVWLAYRR